MATQMHAQKPKIGTMLMFTAVSSPPLAGIPARVIHVWPRFRSGDYLVTLEYAQPVRFGNQLIQHIDAFMSELEPSAARARLRGRAYPLGGLGGSR